MFISTLKSVDAYFNTEKHGCVGDVVEFFINLATT
jgi:hypothetical protein